MHLLVIVQTNEEVCVCVCVWCGVVCVVCVVCVCVCGCVWCVCVCVCVVWFVCVCRCVSKSFRHLDNSCKLPDATRQAIPVTRAVKLVTRHSATEFSDVFGQTRASLCVQTPLYRKWPYLDCLLSGRAHSSHLEQLVHKRYTDGPGCG